jgi:hypothetical protein
LAGSLLSGRVGQVRRQGRAVAACVALWGAAIAASGVVSLAARLALLALAGGADVVSPVMRMTILAQVTPDELQGRVSSGLCGDSGRPRLGDAEAGGAAALAGPQAAA